MIFTAGRKMKGLIRPTLRRDHFSSNLHLSMFIPCFNLFFNVLHLHFHGAFFNSLIICLLITFLNIIWMNEKIVIIKFHFWKLSGYSDLSVEEGIVGARESICGE